VILLLSLRYELFNAVSIHQSTPHLMNSEAAFAVVENATTKTDPNCATFESNENQSSINH
jgi:hypothetical protein